MAVKVGDGPAARRYKAMLAADKKKADAKPAPKKAPAKPAKKPSLMQRIKDRKKAFDV